MLVVVFIEVTYLWVFLNYKFWIAIGCIYTIQVCSSIQLF